MNATNAVILPLLRKEGLGVVDNKAKSKDKNQIFDDFCLREAGED